MVFGLLHHGAVAGLVKQRRDRAGEPPAGFSLFFAGAQQLSQLLQLQKGLVVIDLRFGQGHIGDEDDFLAKIVKCDDLVKQHQVNVLEILAVRSLTANGRLAVTEVIVGEIPHQTAGEGGQPWQLGAFVVSQNLPQIGGGVIGLNAQAAGLQHTAAAGDLQFGVKAEKGVAAPLFPVQNRFQKKAVGRDILENAQCLDGGAEIREQLAVDWIDLVLPGGRRGANLVIIWLDFHGLDLLVKNETWVRYWLSGLFGQIKNAPDRTNGFCQGRIIAIIRGATLNSQRLLRAFAGYQHIPGK